MTISQVAKQAYPLLTLPVPGPMNRGTNLQFVIGSVLYLPMTFLATRKRGKVNAYSTP